VRANVNDLSISPLGTDRTKSISPYWLIEDQATLMIFCRCRHNRRNDVLALRLNDNSACRIDRDDPIEELSNVIGQPRTVGSLTLYSRSAQARRRKRIRVLNFEPQ